MNAYPKPSAMGGTIIRRVMSLMKECQVKLPMEGPLYLATSGGVDSMVLAHLISRYGRRIVSPDQITLLHFDHQWRKESGTVEKRAVQALARKCGVKALSVKLETHRQNPLSKNLEEDARLKRNEQYAALAKKGGFVFTAHHADDVVETLVWRFFRGELFEQNEGILFQDNKVLRPFLKVFKEEIYRYAQEEKIKFFEDPTNEASKQNPQQMRAFFRSQLQPLLLKQFPGFKQSVLRYAAARKSIRK